MAVYAGRSRRQLRHIADPFWTKALGPGFAFYTSLGQRQAARAVVTAPPGSTLIVCLPTGEGKTELAWAAALPATRNRGTAVVVVPTVVLAMDLERRIARLLDSLGERSSPTGRYAYTGGLPDDIKRALRDDVRNGTQRVIIAAPEALLTGLSDALDAAATAGYLTHLIIDEAHLVEQWGNEFRPEFQAMSAQRRSWLAVAPPGKEPVTLAMSATLTPRQTTTLQELFGTPESTELVWAAQTRREPSYFFGASATVSDQNEAVLRAVSMLPRPLILYTTTQSSAREWLERLQGAGLRRVTRVSGDVGDEIRRAAVSGWRGEGEDGLASATEFDVVVGTSAFGLGLDMPDVRSVVHACMPETLDRYYQEVGRGGRDGGPSIAYLVSTRQDHEIAARLNQQVVISADKGWTRWTSLKLTAVDLQDGRQQVNLDQVPAHLVDESARNRQWNVRTLNLMVRAGLITLDAPRRPQAEDSEDDEQWYRRLAEYNESALGQVVVGIVDGKANDPAHWRSSVESQRTLLVREQTAALSQLRKLIAGSHCVNEVLADYYRMQWEGGILSTGVNCRGCPQCRMSLTRTAGVWTRECDEPFPSLPAWLVAADPLMGVRGRHRWVSAWWRDQAHRDDRLGEILTRLVRKGLHVLGGPGLDSDLIRRVQRGAWPRPVVWDRDANLLDTYEGPMIWVVDGSVTLPDAVRSRLCVGPPTYIFHPQGLADHVRAHLLLSQTADVSMSLETLFGEL